MLNLSLRIESKLHRSASELAKKPDSKKLTYKHVVVVGDGDSGAFACVLT